MAEQGEDPEGIRGPPVVLVAVDDHCRVATDALGTDELREGGSVDIVALDRVVEVGVPVDLHGALDVARLVQQHVFVGFDNDEAGGAEVRLEPVPGDESLGVGEGRELGCGIDFDGHGSSELVDRVQGCQG